MCHVRTIDYPSSCGSDLKTSEQGTFSSKFTSQGVIYCCQATFLTAECVPLCFLPPSPVHILNCSPSFHTLFHTSIWGRQRVEKQRHRKSELPGRAETQGSRTEMEECMERKRGDGEGCGGERKSLQEELLERLLVFQLTSSCNFSSSTISKPRPGSNQAIFLCNKKINHNLLLRLQSRAVFQYDC